MPALDPTLRDQLATVIGKENRDDGARAIAEAGAKAALEALAVHLPAPHGHLDEQAVALRNRLRARARQLGDARRPDRGHEMGHLVEQCAYEHWHRMLFARFLAENDLLIHPEYGTAVTLAECAELAPAEGARDAWELAARYASRMLPQIFRSDDPVLEVRLPPEHVHELERLVASLPIEVFKASDSLGWVYQFWQARRKKEVNASEVKIGADELPAVTQLFTEPYMVQFLLQNTLGAWWVGAGRSLPMEMPYLRRLDDGTPAAGRFEGWPKHARDLKVLDPCCGSGHFLVAAFEMLVPLRMQEEHFSPREACDAVLRDNLFGLEIDYRCTQIAAFALALAAWRYPGAGGWRPLPALNLACSGLAVAAKESEWLALANSDPRLRAGMERLYRLFQQGPTLGSLINPRALGGDLLEAGFATLQPLLTHAAGREGASDERHELAVTAQGLAKAAEILAGQFTLVATNVPYLGRGKQDHALKEFCDRVHPETKTDLATCFVERCLEFCAASGSTALVTPQNWLLLGAYKKLRKRLLRDVQWEYVARLGAGAFATIGGEVVNVTLTSLTRRHPNPDHPIASVDVVDAPSPSDKADGLRSRVVATVPQAAQASNPDSVVSLVATDANQTLRAHADCWQGLVSSDDKQFVFRFWEFPRRANGWEWLQLQPQQTTLYTGRSALLRWDNGQGPLHRNSGAHNFPSAQMLGRQGIAIQRMHDLNATIFSGEVFGDHVAPIVPRDPTLLSALWCFCTSEVFRAEIRKVDNTLKAAVGAFLKVPFDAAPWRMAASSAFPNGLPAPESNDPTQWLFDGNPVAAADPLQVAVARLLGYRWPRQTGSSFPGSPTVDDDDVLDALEDDDGIVCVPPVRGERSAADRVRDLLARAYAKKWNPHHLTELLARVGFAERSLDEWLRNGFFEQHCALFHQRPFVWQVWDGHRDGFSALVNYHRLDRKGLESLTYTYLGDWIASQERANKAKESGAGDRLAKAKELQRKLELILDGETPYDIFVRWKPIEKQPIGWEPDLNDGVRINIRPFVEAGVLRWKPNIKWNKDRGKNPAGSPWGEERNNDVHLTLAEKRKARGLK